MFTKNPEVLKNVLTDTSDIVLAAIGSNLVENFLTQNLYEDVLTSLLISCSQRVKSVILCKLTQLMCDQKTESLQNS